MLVKVLSRVGASWMPLAQGVHVLPGVESHTFRSAVSWQSLRGCSSRRQPITARTRKKEARDSNHAVIECPRMPATVAPSTPLPSCPAGFTNTPTWRP